MDCLDIGPLEPMTKFERDEAFASRTKELGIKHDDGKVRFELLPAGPLTELAKVYSAGARKYSDHQWRGGLRTTRLFGAALRHAFAWLGGETRNPGPGQEAGLHHLAQAAWNLLAIVEMEVTHPELDDRYKEKKP